MTAALAVTIVLAWMHHLAEGPILIAQRIAAAVEGPNEAIAVRALDGIQGRAPWIAAP